MEDLIVLRRTRGNKGQWKSHKHPYIKMEMPRGTFVVFKKSADLLNVGNGDPIMFALSRKENCAFVYKEDPEEDSYYLSNSGRQYFRFTSKDLMSLFKDFFKSDNTKAIYFEMATEPNQNGMFKLIPSV